MPMPNILEKKTTFFWNDSNMSWIYIVIQKQCAAGGHRCSSSKLTMCLLCDVYRQVRKHSLDDRFTQVSEEIHAFFNRVKKNCYQNELALSILHYVTWR